MARRPLSSFKNLWQRHQAIYVNVFSVALVKLAEGKVPTADEDAISEMLCPILTQVCFELGYDVKTPIWEGPIQPVAVSELKGGKKRKRPDFTCRLSNPFASSAEEHELPLHIECKRLGSPSSPSWKLNENYIINGVKRFDSATYEYGKRALSGVMIGYIINMTPSCILNDVNSCLSVHLPSYSALAFQFNSSPLFVTKQKIRRKNVDPINFELQHLWVDLRKPTIKL